MRPFTQEKLKSVGQALLFILVCQLAGILGAVFTVTGESAWYQNLDKPIFNPPSWVFAPVWTLLYTLMGIAVYLVWKRGWHRYVVKKALAYFAVQLVLNARWTPIFYGAHQVGLALIVIGLLWVAILATMLLFYQRSKLACWLLLPYLLWVTFATVLNASIWVLN